MSAVPVASARMSPSARRWDIELIRVVCSFLIVWYHSHAMGYDYAYSGLIVFLLLSGFLWGKSKPQTVLSRAKRLLLPWIFWFAVYAIYNLAKGRSALPGHDGVLLNVLAGPNIHLWYLPFLFIALVALDTIRAQAPKTIICAAFFLVAWGLLVAGLFGMEFLHLWARPLPQYVHGLPALLLGAGFGLTSVPDLWGRFKPMLLTLMICAAAFWMSREMNYEVYSLGMMIFIPVLARSRKGHMPHVIERLAGASLGIYLAHPLILIGLAKYHLGSGLIVVVVAYLLSAASTDLIRRYLPRVGIYVT
jgi:fucose 4-O-acetylase-like acetyltransferase